MSVDALHAGFRRHTPDEWDSDLSDEDEDYQDESGLKSSDGIISQEEAATPAAGDSKTNAEEGEGTSPKESPEAAEPKPQEAEEPEDDNVVKGAIKEKTLNCGNEKQDLDEETSKTLGTNQQERIISNYQSETKESKLLVPHIEKQNGNICIKCMLREDETEENIKAGYRVAVAYYTKCLMELKILEDNNEEDVVIETDAERENLLKNVEIPVLLNMGLCHWKQNAYRSGISYCTKAIDHLRKRKLPDESHYLEKGLFRRGMCYLEINETDQAKADLMEANKLASGKNKSVLQGIKDLKEQIKINNEKEKELSIKMFASRDEPTVPEEEEEGFGQILMIFIDNFLLVYLAFYNLFTQIQAWFFGIQVMNIGSNLGNMHKFMISLPGIKQIWPLTSPDYLKRYGSKHMADIVKDMKKKKKD